MLALRKLFAPRAAKMTRPPPMSDAEILKQYGDRPINANVQALAHLMLAGAIIETLIDKHIINYGPATSKSAEAAITAAGGTVEVLPLPWGDRRPPAKGNALTNR